MPLHLIDRFISEQAEKGSGQTLERSLDVI